MAEAKIKLGDVFEIRTEKGRGYFQYIAKDRSSIPVIRVFPKHFTEKQNNLINIVSSNSYYFVGFPLDVAFRRGIVNYIGNYEIPKGVVAPQEMISLERYKSETHWYIVDVNTLKRRETDRKLLEVRRLSPFGIWNDTLLMLRIEQEWTPETWEEFLD